MSRTLRIAEGLGLPLDAVTQTLACIGRKGAGKTYLAGVLAEQMLDAAAQVVVLDAVGTWWGLRVGADGKSKGKDIFVLGGEHGDVAITAEHGARIARFVVEKRVSAVVDVSAFRQGERKRFATDFGEELFQLQKKDRRALHLFVEEAQLFAPQRIQPDEARMFGAFELIVRLGRNYGIGCTLITQRPQSVNKEVLSQVECLCVLQVTGPHERKALEEWVQEAGADRKLVGELPGLHRGEGYVWSPAWLRRYERVKFAKKVTFDASATPEVGKAARAAELPKVDVEALRTDLAEVVKEAEADDPKALRRRIAELERELAKKPAPAAKVERVEVPVLKDAQVTALAVSIERLATLAGKFGDLAAELRHGLERAKAPPAGITTINQMPPGMMLTPEQAQGTLRAQLAERRGGMIAAALARRATYPHSGDAVRAARPTKTAAGEPLPKGERAVLIACAQHPGGCTREQLTVLTGYKRSSRDSYIQRLREKSYLEDAGRLTATEAGVAALGDFEQLPTGRALLQHHLQRLPAGEARILEILAVAGRTVSRDAISDATDYKRSSRDSYLQRLAARELVVVERDGVAASPMLFDGGGR